MTDARQAAVDLLNRLEQGHTTLDRLMEEWLQQTPDAPRRDRALLQTLVYGVLRWRARLDWILAHFSRTPLVRIDPGILNILRLGLFQIVYLDRIPDSAAVNTSVQMAKKHLAPWIGAFVNGLLRNAARGHNRVPWPDPDTDPAKALATAKSFPPWLVTRWLNLMGAEATGRLCDRLNCIPPITIRTNTLKTTRRRLKADLADEVQDLQTTGLAPDGLRFHRPRNPIADMRAFQDGGFQVQDEAAQLVSLLLAPQPGEKVLDACAGLGGKTGHMAQLMHNRGSILALDRAASKLDRLRIEMRRLGIGMVLTRKADLTRIPEDQHTAAYDRILLDAPCSGLGVLRRNPDTKWQRGADDLVRFGSLQLRLLNRLAGWLKPGGIMVYAVCSLEPEENREVLTAFLDRQPKFRIALQTQEVPAPVRPLLDTDGCLRSHPLQHDMDGFFAVRLRRQPC